MKTVLITGASRGIGRAAAIKFAREGYSVAVNYRENADAANEVCREITQNGGIALPFKADVSSGAEVKEMSAEVYERLGEIDVLVNNAGVALKQGLFTDFSEESCTDVFNTNVFGMMNCCREFIPHFVKKHSGKIINVSSVWGICGASCEVIYSASKAAVIGFTKALAKELAPSGINVNCVAPGMVETDMNAHLSSDEIEAFKNEVPMMKIGKASEIADVIYFLASEASAYMTGQVVSVDGGII